ncbi:MAG: hypothetical protein HY302_05160 [Opitutae bacterium]|nr:hypothetical protein [Opitutae bacterium]
MKFTITSVDYEPSDLHVQLPVNGEIVRQYKQTGIPDLFLARLTKQISWETENETKLISYIVISARWVGGSIDSLMKGTPVNISYVLNPAETDGDTLDFTKCAFVAIGAADSLT